jgi:membrane fusion protein (multidrug efflux system)
METVHPQRAPSTNAESSPAPLADHRELDGLPRRTRRKRRLWRWVAILGGLFLVLGGFAYYWFFMRPYESTDDAFIDGNVIPVAPQVAGQVIQLLVQDNELVKQGQRLLEIDPRDYEARLAQAQAELSAAQTKLEQSQAQVVSDQARVEQERASLTAAQTESDRAQADLKRYQSLPSPAVSRSQLDLAIAQARSNTATVAVAQSRMQAAEAQLAVSKAGIQAAQAGIQSSQAGVRQAQLELSYTRLAAPQAGYVTHRTVEVGSYVQPGQALFALVSPDVWVVANFKETQLTQMRPGQPVTVKVDAYPQHVFQAHVDSLQRGSGARFSLLPPENATGNYVKVVQRVPVKILFDTSADQHWPLGPGMSVVPTVDILAAAERNTSRPGAAGAVVSK